jgi:hypothetical protein
MLPFIEVSNVSLYYGHTKALKDISVKLGERVVTAFIGPSGCGKSTLLRCLNRMNDLIDNVRIEGSIKIGGHDIYAQDVDVIELRKRVGMVFQKSNPFPKSIFENVAYGLRLHGIKTKSELDGIVEQSLRGAALWDEVKDRLHGSALGLVRRPTATALHRARHRYQAGNHPHGRAGQRARSHRDFPHRRFDFGFKKGLYHRHCHTQYATGGAHFRPDRILLHGRAGRIWHHLEDFYQPGAETDGGLRKRPVWMSDFF